MQSVVYDGTFEGFLSSVFDVYEYKFTEVDICPQHRFNGNVFGLVHTTLANQEHSDRVWKGLGKKLTTEALGQLYKTFLSELPGIENRLLHYIQYAFSNNGFMETDFSNAAVVTITQTAKKVWREKHRMEAFVRFQKTAEELYYSIIEPDYNVLPLIKEHFEKRYADQRWLIFDSKRKYGLYYDGQQTTEITLNFEAGTNSGKNVTEIFSADEAAYQQLWQQYFTSVNIAARKNTKLHIQHMPRRYWKYLPEKKLFDV